MIGTKARPLVGIGVILLGAGVLFVGCDALSSSSGPAQPTQATTTSAATPPSTVSQVFTIEGDAAGGSALAVAARDEELEPAVRVAALRRLEEDGAPETLPTAAVLAREAPGLVRDNAVATLARLNAAEAISGLDPDAQALARALAERAR